MPQYMLLLHEDPKAFADISPAEMGKVVVSTRLGARRCAPRAGTRAGTS
jgi:hypothetical protein